MVMTKKVASLLGTMLAILVSCQVGLLQSKILGTPLFSIAVLCHMKGCFFCKHCFGMPIIVIIYHYH